MTKDVFAKTVRERDEARAERDHYRSALFKKLIADAAADGLARFGGRSKALNLIVERQLAVREVDGKFAIAVVDPDTGADRYGVSLSDLLTQMRSSDEYSRAFETKDVGGPKKLANNPWAKETENLTEQARLLKVNPGLAARMQREARAS